MKNLMSVTSSIVLTCLLLAGGFVCYCESQGTIFQSTAAKVYERKDALSYYRKNLVIELFWEIEPYIHDTIRYFEIEIMDMYKPVSEETYDGSSRSIELDLFVYNRTRVVANMIYNITISAIVNYRIRYPSDPIIVNTFYLTHCDFSSPSIGTIRVSCNISHPIKVNLTCTNNCTNPIVIVNGRSPLTVRGLNPGVMYSVNVTVFNYNEVGLSDQTLAQNITVNAGIKINIGALVGGIIGGVVFIIIIIIIVLLVRYYYVSHKRKSPASDDDDDKASLQRSPMLQTSESY